MFKEYLYKLSFSKRRRLIRLINQIRTFGKTNDLNYLATVYKTDKWGKHFYTPHYFLHFSSFKNKRVKLLEIGIGGYEIPTQGGGSLRMWERFFSKGEIHGLDIYDKTILEEGRIKIHVGSQIDKEFLEGLSQKIGGFDIIIDDGSHLNHHIISTFEILFPILKDNGIYVIEDVQTSYWKDFGGDPENPDSKLTAVGYFKNLIHGLNYTEFPDMEYIPNYFDRSITSIHFYHNLIFIFKGKNN